jgi:hypothetical protein
MALTEQSIERALQELGGSSVDAVLDSDLDPTSLEMARLLKVVEVANGGNEPRAVTTFGMFGGKDTVIEKLGELIAKLRSVLADLVRKIPGTVSFSIGLTGPVLSVSVNFNS